MGIDILAWVAIGFLVSVIAISIALFWWVMKMAKAEREAIEHKNAH
jgi:hypothetical protein